MEQGQVKGSGRGRPRLQKRQRAGGSVGRRLGVSIKTLVLGLEPRS